MTCIELHYLRDGSALAVDATRRVPGAPPQARGRLALAGCDAGGLAVALADFEAAYGEALSSGDRSDPVLRRASAVSRVLRERVQPAAQRLARLLLPDELGEWLMESPSPSLQIVCDADLMHLPFEALWFQGDFLGHRFAMARRLITFAAGVRGRMEVSAPARCALVVDPGNILKSVGKGGQPTRIATVFDDLLAGWNRAGRRHLQIPNGSRRLGEATDAGELSGILTAHDVVMILGHHEADGVSAVRGIAANGRGLQIGAGTYYSGADLFEAMRGVSRPPWLLCCLCCVSGAGRGWQQRWRDPDSMNEVQGLADAARRAGIPNFVGTLFEVHAEYVVEVIGPILGAVNDGYSAADALLRGRRAMRAGCDHDPFHPGTLPGLALTLLGETASGLVSASGRRIDFNHPVAADAVWCGHVAAGVQCRRAVAGPEPGRGTGRCPEHFTATQVCSAGHLVEGPLQACQTPGCKGTYCPRCSASIHQRCWQHAGAGGIIDAAVFGCRCLDRYGLHPGEPRMVHIRETGFREGMCPQCWEHRRRKVLSAG